MARERQTLREYCREHDEYRTTFDVRDAFLPRHKLYNTLLTIGYFFWMASGLIIPFVAGTIYYLHPFGGFAVLATTFFFSGGLVLPAGFVIAFTLHPFLLKLILFNKKYPYFEEIAEYVGAGLHKEHSARNAIIAGSFLDKLFK